MRSSAAPPLRFELGERPPRRHGAVRFAPIAAALFLCAVGVALAWTGHLGFALTALGLAPLSAWLLGPRAARAARRELVADARGLDLSENGRPGRAIVSYGQPFGITLFTSPAHDRLVVALTTGDEVTYIGAHLDDEQRRALRPLLVSASTLSDDEALLDVTDADTRSLAVAGPVLADLLAHLREVDPRAFERCLLSDTHGAPVVLDGPELRVGKRTFDLSAPLEWRGSLFQERFGSLSGGNDRAPDAPPTGGVLVYQATWIRQGSTESVLVSLIESLLARQAPAIDESSHDLSNALLRDLRLMQGVPESPPPQDLRVGIERAYTVRLRAALDRAPRTRGARRTPWGQTRARNP